jgi:proline iminopeptidase
MRKTGRTRTTKPSKALLRHGLEPDVACEDLSVPDEMVAMPDGCLLWTETTGDGPPVTLCHGGPGLWDYLLPVAQIAGDSYRIHRWDQRGCGRSGSQGPWTLARYTSDLDALRAHFGYQQWIVAGHSFGADLALRYAIRYPHRVTALIYLCGTGLEWNRHRAAYHRAERDRRSNGEQARLSYLEALDRTADQEREFLRLSWATDYPDHEVGLAAAGQMAAAGMPVNYDLNTIINAESKAESSAALAAACQAVVSPAIIVQGLEDPRPVAVCDSLAQALPSARRVILSAAGHLPWIEAPEQFGRVLREFLATVA